MCASQYSRKWDAELNETVVGTRQSCFGGPNEFLPFGTQVNRRLSGQAAKRSLTLSSMPKVARVC